MAACVYLNGDFIPAEQAKLSISDRGLLFGDGVYEVIPAYNNKLFRLAQHLERLQHSLTAIRLDYQVDPAYWADTFTRLLKKNHGVNGDQQSVYVQITRGCAEIRTHTFPAKITPNIFATASKLKCKPIETLRQGAKVITLDDIRWALCHIKAITLLPNALMAQQASDQGAIEAILIRDGCAIEGTSSNLFIVNNNTIITPPLSEHILGGITRNLVIELANQQNFTVLEQAIPAADLNTADEIWMTSSTKEITPITQLNDQPVGQGHVGPVWEQMIQAFQNYKRSL